MRILLVEDEENIAQPLKRRLEKDGFAVDWEEEGDTGYSNAKFNEYDCIVLDLNLPGIDGLTIANKLREEAIWTPILILTARSQQSDKIIGFEQGADDYLTKPFNYKELYLRINALIKRSKPLKNNSFQIANLNIDLDNKTVSREGERINLNLKEFGILEYLIRNRGKYIKTEELLEHVWDSEIDTFTQTVKTTIKTLRQKIDPDKKLIQTKKGFGYFIA